MQIIYIAGCGRSGSTVLDIVLGNHHAVESVGELDNAARVWDSADEYCACGETASACPYWRDVRSEWTAALTQMRLDLNEWRNLQIGFEQYRALPRVLALQKRPTESFRRYGNGVLALYKAITHASGKEIVVDSSKNPVRALALSQVPGLDLHIVHLVRDGRGVAWSLKKPHQKDPSSGVQRNLHAKAVWRSAMLWTLINRLAEKSIAQIDQRRAVRIRYEDFVNHPASALEQIGSMTDLDYTTVAKKVRKDGVMTVGHNISGNRLRMHGAIRLQPDNSWKENLSSRDKRIFWALAGRLSARYGYRWEK